MTETARQVDYVLIGVDGGATEVKAHAVACDDPDDARSFELRAEAASRKYERVPGFQPVPLTGQLAQRDGGRTGLSAQEDEQGALWIDAAGEVVAEVVERCGVRRALVGMGMPGLKTPNGRGICVINNGPRVPDYLCRFERRLAEMGVELIAPVARLGSDADYCGLGEEHAAEGSFRGIDSAYYAGGGTGVADAMKLRGRLVPFDQAKTWILKSWQIPSAVGPTFEKLVSAQSLNECYFNLIGVGPQSDTAVPCPEVHAAEGRPLARTLLNTTAMMLAELLFERIDTTKNGRRAAPHRGPVYRQLDAEHEYRGTLLDRVVIGQRVGKIYADPRFRAVFAEKVDAHLAAFLAESGDRELVARYLEGNSLRPGVVYPSRLRAAPALGAAVDAVQAWAR